MRKFTFSFLGPARPWPGRPGPARSSPGPVARGLSSSAFPSAFFVRETKCISKKSTFCHKQAAKFPFLENGFPERVRAQIE